MPWVSFPSNGVFFVGSGSYRRFRFPPASPPRESSMLEDAVTRLPATQANAPSPVNLRRIGAHPDHWYPLAWADELKKGRTLARRFAAEPIVLYRGQNGQAYALED